MNNFLVGPLYTLLHLVSEAIKIDYQICTDFFDNSLSCTFQSCHASKTMEKMLVRAFNDTHTSRGAALCRQQQLLKVSALSQQASPSSPKAINMDALQDCEVRDEVLLQLSKSLQYFLFQTCLPLYSKFLWALPLPCGLLSNQPSKYIRDSTLVFSE